MTAFRKALSRAGLRITPQRTEIYACIAGMKNHPSTEQVYSTVRHTLPSVSFDTVHRTLKSFCDLGIISGLESYSGTRRFEPDLSPHHHLHCIGCGTVIDFISTEYDGVRLPPGDARFTPLGLRVSVYGYCAECRNSAPDRLRAAGNHTDKGE